jgi:peptidoglycan/xylan/chitin deacetylase (PgdA/CDA1 family)
MGIRLLRALCCLVILFGLCDNAAADAGDCPGHPDALGVSRTLVVDPHQHTRIGSMSYAETLPLRDHEVVLTFDDGPLPPYTDRILSILAAQCIHATYFMVGEMAKAFPAAVRRVYEAGHTIGTHSMSHPYPFRSLGLDRSKAQIEDGIVATAAALGDASHLAPFFRFPGFAHTTAVDDYLASRGLMAWGADVPADDWKKISPAEVARRAIRRLKARGKGILLLHDIHERTVEALPIILEQLKANGFRIVHVLPSSADRPATVTSADAWLSHPHRKTPLPVVTLAELADGENLVGKTADALCKLSPSTAEGAPEGAALHKTSAHRARTRLASRHHRRRTHRPTHIAHTGPLAPAPRETRTMQ